MTEVENVILVDESDFAIGTMEKMEAHTKGALHRAFSVFVFNTNDELLLHRRALGKYHSAGLWTNTCCSHPRENETLDEAAHRRLQEEMGFDCPLTKLFSFTYRAELDNGLIEYELDHVFIGHYDGTPQPNAHEVMAWEYVPLDELITNMHASPNDYTAWFKIALPRLLREKVDLQTSLT
jgi:isopentenyl-diphosphate Delta-isomerase